MKRDERKELTRLKKYKFILDDFMSIFDEFEIFLDQKTHRKFKTLEKKYNALRDKELGKIKDVPGQLKLPF